MNDDRLSEKELALLKICIEKHRPDLLPAFNKITTEIPDLETAHAMRSDAVGTELIIEGFYPNSEPKKYGLELEKLIDRLADIYIWPYEPDAPIKKTFQMEKYRYCIWNIRYFIQNVWESQKPQFISIATLTVLLGIPVFLVIILIIVITKD